MQGQESLPNATAILVIGILSIFFCQLLGLVALIMGNNSLALYSQNPSKYTEASYNNVKAGKICGIIGLCLIGLWILLMFAGISIFGIFAGFFSHHN